MHPLDQSLPPPPRALSCFRALRLIFHRARSSVLFLVGTIFLIVGLGLTIGLTGTLWAEIRRERALLATGASADATVVAKRAYTRGGPGDETRVYELDYEFPLADGRSWATTREIEQSEWNRLHTGDHLEVRYDRGNPNLHELPAFATPAPLSLIALFPLVFVVLGVLLFRSSLREVTGPLRLYRTGEATNGRVTRFDTVANETMNGRHPVRIRYAFTDRTSGDHEGSIKTLDDELLDALEEGTAVTVLYDRQRPQLNTLLAGLGHNKGNQRAGSRSWATERNQR